jgi:hypothetical protein
MATRVRILQIRVLAQKLPFLASTRTRQNSHFQKYARLARLADICQAVLGGLADIFQTILRELAGLADICQTILRGLARLADIRQRPFLRKM